MQSFIDNILVKLAGRFLTKILTTLATGLVAHGALKSDDQSHFVEITLGLATYALSAGLTYLQHRSTGVATTKAVQTALVTDPKTVSNVVTESQKIIANAGGVGHSPAPPTQNFTTALLFAIGLGITIIFLTGCATGGSGVTATTSTIFGIEIAYVQGETMPSVKAGLIRNEYVRAGTNDNYQVLKATDIENHSLFTTKLHTVTAIGAVGVTQPSAAQQMPPLTATGVALPVNAATVIPTTGALK